MNNQKQIWNNTKLSRNPIDNLWIITRKLTSIEMVPNITSRNELKIEHKRNSKENAYKTQISIKYFRCMQQGHKSNECPMRKQLNVIYVDVKDEIESNNLYDNLEVEDVHGDEGETITCVLEKLLMAPRQSTLPQRHAIFRTKCTNAIKGV